jgi:hypothetical protein
MAHDTGSVSRSMMRSPAADVVNALTVEILALRTEKFRRLRAEIAVARWLHTDRDLLVFDDGVTIAHVVDAPADVYGRMFAAVVDSIANGKRPDALLRRICECRHAFCPGCGGDPNTLSIPSDVLFLIAEVRCGA